MDEPTTRLIRPWPAAALVCTLVFASFACLVCTSTGDAITLTSRVAAFLLPIAAGLPAVVIAAALTPRATWLRCQRLSTLALGVYVALLGVAGFATAASGIGVVGPPPMPPGASTPGDTGAR